MRSSHAPFLVVALLLVASDAKPQSPGATTAAPQYQPTFAGNRGRAVPVTLSSADGALAFTWPDVGGAWDTALLGVEIQPAATAIAPWVEIAAGDLSDRQHFPPAGAGLNWLNVSFLRGSVPPGSRVTVRGDALTIAEGSATLRVFANSAVSARSLLIIAPHPDDAEIAAFGLYASRRSTVVTVTAGNAGPPSYRTAISDPAAHYQFKGRVRVIDSITVPWQGGVAPERAFNMGYFDARLAEMHDAPSAVVPERYGPNTDIGIYLQHNFSDLLPKRPRASTWANLVDDLEKVVKKVKPDAIVAPHPQLDSHLDHQFTAVALGQALARWNRRVELLLYTNHADQNRYPYGPAGTIMSIPPSLAPDVPLDSVYSFPLSRETQRLKLFALESMHDLRMSPSRQYQLVTGEEPFGEADPPASGVGYFRRGVRSNELFFVYGRERFVQMLDTFLATWRARPRG